MKYLLDTDHITILQNKAGPEYAVLSARMAAHPATDFGLPVVSFHEQVLGAHAYLNRARRPADLVRGYVLLRQVLDWYAGGQVVQFDSAAANALIGLQTLRLRTAAMDLRIAAVAMARGLTLLSRNTSDFGGIPGLIVEDWTV